MGVGGINGISNRRIFLILFTSVVIAFWIWYSFDNYNWFAKTPPGPRPSDGKLILLWTPYYLASSLEAWNVHSGFPNCQFKCYFTLDKSYVTVSDAVVYHGYPEATNWLGESILHPLPNSKHRDPNQVWIYQMGEPPSPHWDLYETLKDSYDFNWTMTYRSDSDIFFGYGKYDRIPNNIQIDQETMTPLRDFTSRKLAVGLISECGRTSGRDAYIKELQKYIPVDIYGKCGTLTCSRSQNCYKILSEKYKFWLSFENSICLDYVTEKLFHPLTYGAVPVYFGHPDGPKNAPPGSYIHTKDYQSPQALANYLLHLDSHLEEYSKYFEWKTTYRLGLDITSDAYCQVCKMLHGVGSGQVPAQSYKSIREWFLRNNTNQSVCLDPH